MRLDHTRILFSYLSNFPLAEMEALKNATETWVNAAMNGNYSESMNARAAFYSTVANCVNNLVLSGHVLTINGVRRDGKYSVTHAFGSGKRINKIYTHEQLTEQINKLTGEIHA